MSYNHTRVTIGVEMCGFVAADRLKQSSYYSDVAGSNPAWGVLMRSQKMAKQLSAPAWLWGWLQFNSLLIENFVVGLGSQLHDAHIKINVTRFFYMNTRKAISRSLFTEHDLVHE